MISITFDPLKEAGRMTVRPFNPMVSRIFGALVKSMDRIWGLDPDVPVTQSFDGYRECCISHGVEDGNDFTDRVVKRGNHSLLDIGIRDHIVRIHVVEHGMIGSDQDSDGSDGWVPILVRVDPFESTIGKQTLDEHKVMHFPLITKRYIRAKKGERWFWHRRCPRKQSVSRFISNKGQKYKSSVTKLRCSYDPSVDGCLRVTLAKMTDNDSQVVSRYLRQSPTS